MSNRSSSYRQESNSRGFRGKTQKKFVPKNPNLTPPNTTDASLSASLRHSFSGPPSTSGSGSGSVRPSRVRLGENGEWVSSKIQSGGCNFVNYLPQDEAVAVGLGADEGGLDAVESQRVVDLLNRELAKLLKLKPRYFWSQVAEDASLHEFLDSFLKFRSRWYDFPSRGAKGVVAGVIVGDLELSHRVFMVLYRISSNRDPGVRATDSLSQKDHEALLQEKKLLDLPKLLDICAIYGHENEDLTRALILNAIHAQPWIHNSLTSMISHFLGIVQTMYQRCSSSLEALISAGGFEHHGSGHRHLEYLEVMDFLNDAVVSMDTFVSAYRPAAIFFSCPVDASHGNEETINVLAMLHDSLIPSLQQGLQIILAAGDKTSSLSDVFINLRILSARIVDLGWKLLDNCYLSDELFKDNVPFPAAMKMFPASIEDPVIRADILVQTFKEIAAVPNHVQGKHYRGIYLQNIERKHQILQKIHSLQHSGWIHIDDEQYQYLAGMLIHPMSNISNKSPAVTSSVTSDGLQKEEEAAIAQSKISQVKDLFPDYGNGFISACLEVYDHNPEEVIQRILEGTLHEDLQTLDTSMETVPPKATPSLKKNDKGKGKLVESTASAMTNTGPPKSAPSLNKNDKGKGKLVESTASPTINTVPLPQKPRSEVTTSSSQSYLTSSVGRFVRKSNDAQADNVALDLRDDKHTEKTAALLAQYEYEDEYDDSFDDLGMTIVESGVEETESLGERIRSGMSMSSGSEGQSSAPSAGSGKWNSRKKPQYYVKDGKNYSYKVEGAIAVADQKQASLVNQAQKELIHGLGRGGNRPIGAVKQLEEQNDVEDEVESSEVDRGGNAGRGKGRGRGRRGSGGNRKDRAMRKHMASVGGF